MTTEGTYPFASGGVSTWCDALIRNTPDVNYTLLPLMMNPHIEAKYDTPPNVRRVITAPLWGIEEPSEFLEGIPFARLYDRKRRTTTEAIETVFLPPFRDFLQAITTPSSAAALGPIFVRMEDYFRVFDYNETFKSQPVWEIFKASMEWFSRRMAEENRIPGPEHQLPSLFDITECLRWLYRFLIILNARVPRTSVTHTTAAAFCGIKCITEKVRHGTPMLVTEHGVYLREQNLFLSRFRRLFFSKQFLLNLITAVVRANYHYADIVAPVCRYNTRWEIAHDTAPEKIVVVHNGVDERVFTPMPKPQGELHVVTTARIDPLKDIETLLHVADRVRRSYPSVRFTVYGTVADEPYYRRCLALREKLGLTERVAMGVPAENIVAAYHDADIILLTSVSEAFPYSVLEAMSCGRAVVASDVGGVQEALEGSGILVRPRDEAGFTAAIIKLLGDRSLRLHFGARGRERVLQDFRLEQSIARYRQLYEQLALRQAAA